jgi:hypothetical protein
MLQQRGRRSRTIAHIGCLFSDLVVTGQLSFLGARTDSMTASPEFRRDTASRSSRQAGQCSIALA